MKIIGIAGGSGSGKSSVSYALVDSNPANFEVINLDDSMIEDTPAFGVDLDTDFILGIAKVNQKVITLLDIDKILTSRQLVMIQN